MTHLQDYALAQDLAKKRLEAHSTIFAYIEDWYNRQRLHSFLDYLSPMEYEVLFGH